MSACAKVRPFLRKTLGNPRRPAARELLQSADIEIAIVEEALQRRHLPRKKAPILTDAVAAHRRCARQHPRREKLKRARLGDGSRYCACAHAREKPRGAVLILVPVVHGC